MITQLSLKNFKCFKSSDIKIAPLTVLAGINSVGKSTVIESMLLLRESKMKSESRDIPLFNLRLNNQYMHLGTGMDVLCDFSDNDEIGIQLYDTYNTEMVFDGAWLVGRDNPSSVLEPIDIHQRKEEMGIFEKSALFAKNNHQYIDFSFISADRLGPRSRFEVPDESVEINHNIGNKGEYAAFYFDYMHSKKIPIAEIAESEEANDIGSQVNKWMGHISPGYKIHTHVERDMDAVQLSYVKKNGAKDRRSSNVGFGLTYTFPIVIALLTVRRGGLVLLENPEAHLHPKAQSMIGDLIARVVQNGVQVILETHSDHIINGIRVAIKEKRLVSDKLLINFFSEPQENVSDPVVTEIHANNEGKLNEWPQDFMSEWEDNLFKLI